MKKLNNKKGEIKQITTEEEKKENSLTYSKFEDFANFDSLAFFASHSWTLEGQKDYESK